MKKDINEIHRIRKQIRDEFLKFIKSQSILGVAIGIVIGQALASLINAIVGGLVMPVLELFYQDKRWEQVTLNIGHAQLKIGSVIGSMLNFFIVSVVVFFLIKFILKEEGNFYNK